MASRSDFAQKLLNDLRTRKERMFGGSQSSSRNNATGRDAYRNPANMQRGSRHTKSLESIGGSKTLNHRFTSSDRSFAIKESSQQLVSYDGGGRRPRSEPIGDLSMAFTYAVKNGGKLMNVDFSGSANANKMIDFLHQIGRRSLDAGTGRNDRSIVQHHRHSSSTGMPPALTAVQIKEISKGVQNLYEIIRSSSNGMNVSMEVGKELLKGAKGLEESLRMLVNLQEASEMMATATPQRKNRITLLEVDDDDEDDIGNGAGGSKIVDRNQVALPRFSFDKPSKRSHFPLTDANSSTLATYRRPATSGSESVRTVSDGKTTSNRSEKGRISNVIAKLMGLEEVPGKVDEPRIGIAEKQVNKIPKPVKDAIVTLTDRKSQQLPDSNINGVPRSPRASVGAKQSSTDRVPEKPERRSNYETNEKIRQKHRVPEIAPNPRVEKKKSTRIEKSNEIRLVPRNNQPREPEKRTQKSKEESHQIKHSHNNQVKPNNSPSKHPKVQPFEENLKPKDATPMAHEPELERIQEKVQPVVSKEKVVARKKVDLIAIDRSEALRRRDEGLKRRNGIRDNLERQLKHKLSVLKETKHNDVQKLGPIRSTPEDTSSITSSSKKSESVTRYGDDIINTITRVPICENDIKIEPQETSDIVVVATKYAPTVRIPEARNLPEHKPKKTFPQVILTDQEKQLKEILIKDQLFLSTAEALFKLNIPVGFLHADDHNHHHGDETKAKLDCGHEILRRKARSQELSAHPYLKPSVGCKIIRFLDELVKQLYKDLEGLRLYGRNAQNEADEADYLHHMLERDIYNTNPDTNSFWDLGWDTMTFGFVEKDEFVKDVERDLLSGLVDDIVDELLNVRLRF